MLDFIFLNLLLVAYLLLLIAENTLLPSYKTIKKTKISLDIKIYIITLLIFGIILSTLQASLLFNKAINIIFILLIVSHTLLISMFRSKIVQVFSYITSFAIIFTRFFFPTQIAQNLFILFALIWLGPFLTKMKILTVKRFAILGTAWILYSFLFLLFKSSTMPIFTKTETVRLPFSIVMGSSYLGLIDLIVPSCVLSLLRNREWQILAIFIFIISNLIVGIIAFQTYTFSVFPISVIWTVAGLFLLWSDRNFSSHQ